MPGERLNGRQNNSGTGARPLHAGRSALVSRQSRRGVPALHHSGEASSEAHGASTINVRSSETERTVGPNFLSTPRNASNNPSALSSRGHANSERPSRLCGAEGDQAKTAMAALEAAVNTSTGVCRSELQSKDEISLTLTSLPSISNELTDDQKAVQARRKSGTKKKKPTGASVTRPQAFNFSTDSRKARRTKAVTTVLGEPQAAGNVSRNAVASNPVGRRQSVHLTARIRSERTSRAAPKEIAPDPIVESDTLPSSAHGLPMPAPPATRDEVCTLPGVSSRCMESSHRATTPDDQRCSGATSRGIESQDSTPRRGPRPDGVECITSRGPRSPRACSEDDRAASKRRVSFRESEIHHFNIETNNPVTTRYPRRVFGGDMQAIKNLKSSQGPVVVAGVVNSTHLASDGQTSLAHRDTPMRPCVRDLRRFSDRA
eukprot:TRINITY_DN30843_c0_g1_i1.p1 TRINITY_DN30843_c0_g1~~TRINITY_DN30843_c0_g1_i1.p1  ORF type:complete len:432 (+),score=23.51 TRINITY_DN30843_c0_g1_i1:21-1316(+)